MTRFSKNIFLLGGLAFTSIFAHHLLAPDPNDEASLHLTKSLPKEDLSVSQKKDETHPKTPDTPQHKHHKNTEAPIEHSIERRMEIVSERREGKLFSREEIESALQQDSAWETSKNIPQNLPLTNEDLYDGRMFIQTNPLRFETLLVGDELPFIIPQTDSQHIMQVSQTKNNGKIVMWKGEIDDGEGRFSITRDLSFTTGQVVTPEGTYHFEFHDNIGWIHSQGALFKHQEISDTVPHTNH